MKNDDSSPNKIYAVVSGVWDHSIETLELDHINMLTTDWDKAIREADKLNLKRKPTIYNYLEAKVWDYSDGE